MQKVQHKLFHVLLRRMLLLLLRSEEGCEAKSEQAEWVGGRIIPWWYLFTHLIIIFNRFTFILFSLLFRMQPNPATAADADDIELRFIKSTFTFVESARWNVEWPTQPLIISKWNRMSEWMTWLMMVSREGGTIHHNDAFYSPLSQSAMELQWHIMPATNALAWQIFQGNQRWKIANEKESI